MKTTITCAVSPEVAAALPRVLVEYIWSLQPPEDISMPRILLLKKQMMGGREIQEVRLLTREQSGTVHKIWGFNAVNATIQIAMRDNAMYMEFAGPLAALGFAACQ